MKFNKRSKEKGEVMEELDLEYIIIKLKRNLLDLKSRRNPKTLN